MGTNLKYLLPEHIAISRLKGKLDSIAKSAESAVYYLETKQELFNSHLKGIETKLWMDGWKIESDLPAEVSWEPENGRYLIFVSARPMRGQTVLEKPLTMSEVVRGEING